MPAFAIVTIIAILTLHLLFALPWAVSVLFGLLIACGGVVAFYAGLFCFIVFMAIRMGRSFSGED